MPEQSELEALLGHSFADPLLLAEALTHGSVRHEQVRRGGEAGPQPVRDNERLEFFGDAVLGLLVSELLFRRYPTLDEGGLTRLRAALVSRKHLAEVGAALSLARWVRVDRSVERSGGSRRGVVLANALEALVAALYLEGGLAAAGGFVERCVVLPYVQQLHGELQTRHHTLGDWKTALQELVQARRLPHPEYVLEEETGPDHQKRFVVEVRIEGGPRPVRARGEGSSKKRADQQAARQAYAQLTGAAPQPDTEEAHA